MNPILHRMAAIILAPCLVFDPTAATPRQAIRDRPSLCPRFGEQALAERPVANQPGGDPQAAAVANRMVTILRTFKIPKGTRSPAEFARALQRSQVPDLGPLLNELEATVTDQAPVEEIRRLWSEVNWLCRSDSTTRTVSTAVNQLSTWLNQIVESLDAISAAHRKVAAEDAAQQQSLRANPAIEGLLPAIWPDREERQEKIRTHRDQAGFGTDQEAEVDLRKQVLGELRMANQPTAIKSGKLRTKDLEKLHRSLKFEGRITWLKDFTEFEWGMAWLATTSRRSKRKETDKKQPAKKGTRSEPPADPASPTIDPVVGEPSVANDSRAEPPADLPAMQPETPTLSEEQAPPTPAAPPAPALPAAAPRAFSRSAHHDLHQDGHISETMELIGAEIGAKRQWELLWKIRAECEGRAGGGLAIAIINWIGTRLGHGKNRIGWVKLREAVENAEGRQIKTAHGELRLQRTAAFETLVVIDSRFQEDHAGRDEFCVYAKDEFKAVHEITELSCWAEFASDRDEIPISADDIRRGLFGTKLRRWMNGPWWLQWTKRGRAAREERREIIWAAFLEFHGFGLEAEAKSIFANEERLTTAPLPLQKALLSSNLSIDGLFQNYDAELEVFRVPDAFCKELARHDPGAQSGVFRIGDAVFASDGLPTSALAAPNRPAVVLSAEKFDFAISGNGSRRSHKGLFASLRARHNLNFPPAKKRDDRIERLWGAIRILERVEPEEPDGRARFEQALGTLEELATPEVSEALRLILRERLADRGIQPDAMVRMLRVMGRVGQTRDRGSIADQARQYPDPRYFFAILEQAPEPEPPMSGAPSLLEPELALARRLMDPDAHTAGHAMAALYAYTDPAAMHRVVEESFRLHHFAISRRTLGGGPSFAVTAINADGAIVAGTMIDFWDVTIPPRLDLNSEIDSSMRRFHNIAPLLSVWIATHPGLSRRFGGMPISMKVSDVDAALLWERHRIFDAHSVFVETTHRRFEGEPIDEDAYDLTGMFPTWGLTRPPQTRAVLLPPEASQVNVSLKLRRQKRFNLLNKILERFVISIRDQATIQYLGEGPGDTVLYRVKNRNNDTFFAHVSPGGLVGLDRQFRQNLAHEVGDVERIPAELVAKFGPALLLAIRRHQWSSFGETASAPGQTTGRAGGISAAFSVRESSIQGLALGRRLSRADVDYQRPGLPEDPEQFRRLDESLRLYASWRGSPELEHSMPPLRGPLGIFQGNMMAPAFRLPETGALLIGLNSAALDAGRSPAAAVFYLRHALDRVDRQYPAVVLRDAEFLAAIRADSPAIYARLRVDLEALFGQWPDKRGYLELLERLPTLKDESHQETAVRIFLADRLIAREEHPAWDLLHYVYNHLPQRLALLSNQPAQIRHAIASLCLDVVLARTRGMDAAIREHIIDLYRTEDGTMDFEKIQRAKLEALRLYFFSKTEDVEAVESLRRVIRVVSRTWSQLNAQSAVAGASEREPGLRHLAEELIVIMTSVNQALGLRLQAEGRFERLVERLPYAIATGAPEAQALIDPLKDALFHYPDGVSDIRRYLAATARHHPNAAALCREVAVSLGIGTILSGFETEAQEIEFLERVAKLVARLQAIWDQAPEGGSIDGRGASHLQSIAVRAMQAHRAQPRKDPRLDPRLYFGHPVEVAETLLDVFQVSTLVMHEAALLHDAGEDVPDAYKLLMEVVDIQAGSPAAQRHLNRLRLSVRMLSDLKRPGSKMSDQNQKKRFYKGLRNPRAVYGKEAFFKNWDVWPIDENDIREIELIKLSDNIRNWNDFPQFRGDPSQIDDTIRELPLRTFRKTFDYVIPGLIEPKDTKVNRPDVERYFGALAKAAIAHSEIDLGEFPQAEPLKNASRDAMLDLQKAIRASRWYKKDTGALKEIVDVRLAEALAKLTTGITHNGPNALSTKLEEAP